MVPAPPALSDLAVELKARVEVVEKEKEQMERSLQAALEKITELQQEVLKLKESEQHWLEEAEAAEKRERALKDQMLDQLRHFPSVLQMIVSFRTLRRTALGALGPIVCQEYLEFKQLRLV